MTIVEILKSDAILSTLYEIVNENRNGFANPLSDGVFKLLLEHAFIRENVINSTLGIMPDDSLIEIAGELITDLDNVSPRVDKLYELKSKRINIDAQQVTKNFPLTRMLYYWASIFVNGLRKGQSYSSVSACAVVVIYYDLQIDEYIREYTLNFGNDEEGKREYGEILRLVQVNAAQWRKADDEFLRCFLSIIYEGLPTTSTLPTYEAELNVNSKVFKDVVTSVASSSFLQSQFKERTEVKGMGELLKEKLREYGLDEVIQQAMQQGVQQGMQQGSDVIIGFYKNQSVQDIAEQVGWSLDAVQSFLQQKGLISI